MTSINKFLDLLTSPSQTGDSIGLQAVVGLIALVIFVWGVRGLLQWKVIDSGKRARYMFVTIISSIVLIASAVHVYHDVGKMITIQGKETPFSGPSYGYTVQHGTDTLSGWEQLVSTASILNTQSRNPKKEQ